MMFLVMELEPNYSLNEIQNTLIQTQNLQHLHVLGECSLFFHHHLSFIQTNIRTGSDSRSYSSHGAGSSIPHSEEQ